MYVHKVEALVASTYDALSNALADIPLQGAPVERDRSTERAIEALAGFALGVFASQIASRLSLGADLHRANAIRAALYREIDKVTPAAVRFASEILDERYVTAATLRARVAERLRASRADAVRIVEAIVAASGEEPVWLGERCDVVALRFVARVEEVWRQLHETSFEAPTAVKPAYYVVEIY